MFFRVSLNYEHSRCIPFCNFFCSSFVSVCLSCIVVSPQQFLHVNFPFWLHVSVQLECEVPYLLSLDFFTIYLRRGELIFYRILTILIMKWNGRKHWILFCLSHGSKIVKMQRSFSFFWVIAGHRECYIFLWNIYCMFSWCQHLKGSW